MQPSPSRPSALLSARYFDGVSAQAHPVELQIQERVLCITGEGIALQVALKDVQWPERTRHGKRVAHLRQGGAIQGTDAKAWDEWLQRSGRSESLVVTMQQSWRWVAGSVSVLVFLFIALQQWGVPIAARALVAMAPPSIDSSLGEATLAAIDRHLMRPSKLPPAEQARLQAALAQAAAAMPAGSLPPWRLVFRKSRIGPNAFALPDGTMVMTDEMVDLVGHDEQVIVGVLAHELGHVRHRHALRMLVQTAALGGLAAMVVGDFSTLLAGVPVLLGQASYSRDAEREADAQAVEILKQAKISPAVMVTLFERLEAHRKAEERIAQDRRDAQKNFPEEAAGKAESTNADQEATEDAGSSWLGIAFASHPADAERIAYFTEAAAGFKAP